jgi:hypothetical protein
VQLGNIYLCGCCRKWFASSILLLATATSTKTKNTPIGTNYDVMDEREKEVPAHAIGFHGLLSLLKVTA